MKQKRWSLPLTLLVLGLVAIGVRYALHSATVDSLQESVPDQPLTQAPLPEPLADPSSAAEQEPQRERVPEEARATVPVSEDLAGPEPKDLIVRVLGPDGLRRFPPAVCAAVSFICPKPWAASWELNCSQQATIGGGSSS